MPISISNEEILETINMVETENLDIRTITMGISLRGLLPQQSGSDLPKDL